MYKYGRIHAHYDVTFITVPRCWRWQVTIVDGKDKIVKKKNQTQKILFFVYIFFQANIFSLIRKTDRITRYLYEKYTYLQFIDKCLYVLFFILSVEEYEVKASTETIAHRLPHPLSIGS